MTQTPQQRDDKPAGPPPKADGGPPKGGPQSPAKPGRSKFFDRTFTVTLSLPKAVFSVLFSFFILVWVFIFGIMLGRGHNPEEVVPELAKVMPAPAAPAQPLAEAPEVLPRQELRYHETLKGKDAGEKPRVAPVAPPPPPIQEQAKPVGKPVEKPAEKPAPQQAAAPVAQPPKPAQQGKPPASTEDQDQTVYDYLYQVAASNNASSADAMRKKLEAAGFSVTIAESVSGKTTWHRILIAFKGRPEDTRAMRDKLAEFGIKNIILRGKAPSK